MSKRTKKHQGRLEEALSYAEQGMEVFPVHTEWTVDVPVAIVIVLARQSIPGALTASRTQLPIGDSL